MTLSPIEYIGSTPRKPKKKTTLRDVLLLLFSLSLIGFTVYKYGFTSLIAAQVGNNKPSVESYISENLTEKDNLSQFLAATLRRTDCSVTYDPAYYEIDYPNGDIPKDKGVCADVVIRAYREIGIDLQKLIHEDMVENYQSYPKSWDLNKPDSNIDHRRVPNLQNFFMRNAKSLTLSQRAEDYSIGDLITMKLSHGASHIGVVVPSPYEGDPTPWIVHNIGIGPQWENSLFSNQITGHFRYKLD